MTLSLQLPAVVSAHRQKLADMVSQELLSHMMRHIAMLSVKLAS